MARMVSSAYRVRPPKIEAAILGSGQCDLKAADVLKEICDGDFRFTASRSAIWFQARCV